ncbi:hypothetical protein NQ317_002716 [Molorchus minor]|uniref:Phosphatidylserine decarboxylase n=1 Tax=Molorchus minor TaxID=1323400 RepID=A0ABQ9K2T8_9CUCU|nr:hypothetical protein NQ317_002716 [Molorchus minor]
MSIFIVKTTRWCLFSRVSQSVIWRRYTSAYQKRLIDSRPASKLAHTRCCSTKSKAGESEWRTIFARFLPVGLCLIAVMQWRAYRRKTGDTVARQWEINCYCMLPLRTVSRCWGWIADKQLPVMLRPPLYKLYASTFGVNISEALHEDLTFYPSLADFFARPLKEGVRKIAHDDCLVSPCDGTVLHFGTVNTEQVEQVKGVTYSLKDFLGENSWRNNINRHSDFRTSLLHQPHVGNTLYQCVIYLAPGDYHRTTFVCQSEYRKVAAWVVLFERESRIFRTLGTWLFFLYRSRPTCRGKHRCKEICLGNSVDLKKGDLMGEFRMGSTIVLIFEAPVHFQFHIFPGDQVKMGQRLGSVEHEKFVDRIDRDKNTTNIKSAS